eukprot:148217-Chlamydomonas_euryale.AAC.1
MCALPGLFGCGRAGLRARRAARRAAAGAAAVDVNGSGSRGGDNGDSSRSSSGSSSSSGISGGEIGSDGGGGASRRLAGSVGGQPLPPALHSALPDVARLLAAGHARMAAGGGVSAREAVALASAAAQMGLRADAQFVTAVMRCCSAGGSGAAGSSLNPGSSATLNSGPHPGSNFAATGNDPNPFSGLNPGSGSGGAQTGSSTGPGKGGSGPSRGGHISGLRPGSYGSGPLLGSSGRGPGADPWADAGTGTGTGAGAGAVTDAVAAAGTGIGSGPCAPSCRDWVVALWSVERLRGHPELLASADARVWLASAGRALLAHLSRPGQPL